MATYDCDGCGKQGDIARHQLCDACREAITSGRRAIDFLKRTLEDHRKLKYQYEPPGHHCGYRVVLEALMQRAKEALK